MNYVAWFQENHVYLLKANFSQFSSLSEEHDNINCGQPKQVFLDFIATAKLKRKLAKLSIVYYQLVVPAHG